MNTAAQGLTDIALVPDKPGANQHQAWLRLGEQGEQAVYDYQGEERISGCYQVRMTVVCQNPLPDLISLLQQPATLVLHSTHGIKRYVHGVVFALAELDRSARHLRYQLTLVPPLALLALRRGVRIFQALSVPDIVEKLLSEAGLSADTRSWRLGGDYAPREYCVQYNESELGFIERLLAEAGIHYHFAHSAEHTLLILADGPEGLDTLAELSFKAEAGLATDGHAIHRFSLGPEVRSGSVSLRDYDFTRPDLPLSPQSLAPSAENEADEHGLEDYRWPGPFTSQARGSQLTELGLAQHRHHREQVQGASNSPQLMAGHYQPLSEHPESAYNQSWLITQLSYQGKQPQVLGELADGQSDYQNSFTAQSWTSPYKPSLQPKPQVPGQQSAIVTGPLGEEIYCDEYGRVKVQFYWDRAGQGDEKTSIWLRVSQGWAGNGYGQFILPRVGMEVLVSFINGDPDRPIITGSLFNGNNAVPYALPEHKTRSTFKTASSPGGMNSNELRFEDKAGSEEIYLHAAKDYQERISNNSHSHIVNDRQQLIEGQHTIEVRGEVHHTVHGTGHWHAKADEHHIINNNRHTLVASKEMLTAGQEIHLSTGQKIVLEAGAELTFKAGGSYLKLDPSGVTLVGPTVDLNNGGSPSKGTPVMAKLVKKLLGSNANDGKGMRSAPSLAATLLPNMAEGNQALQGKFSPTLALTSTPTKDSQQVPEPVSVCDKQVPQAAESGLGNCAFYYQPLHDEYVNKTGVSTWEVIKAWATFWNPWDDSVVAKRLMQKRDALITLDSQDSDWSRHANFMMRHVNCGHLPPDYYVSYGYYYCSTYGAKLQPRLSDQGKKWLESARYLLQKNIEIGLKQNMEGAQITIKCKRYPNRTAQMQIQRQELEIDPKLFKTFAFKTHVPAYLDAGLADLPVLDLLRVGGQPNLEEWFDGQTWEQAIDSGIEVGKDKVRHVGGVLGQGVRGAGNAVQTALDALTQKFSQ